VLIWLIGFNVCKWGEKIKLFSLFSCIYQKLYIHLHHKQTIKINNIMAKVEKKNYFGQYQSAGTNALYDAIELLKENDLYDIINIEDKDVYVHITDDNGPFECKVHTIQLGKFGTHIIVGAKDCDDDTYITDLENNCLMVDWIFVYEAIVDYINEQE
jgi:hypothetical protein